MSRKHHEMGFVTRFFIKPAKSALVQVPTGTFTINRAGKIIASTLPVSFSAEHIQTIGDDVLTAFRSAERALMPIAEMVIQYSTLRLVARGLRGGAIVFLSADKADREPEAKARAKPETAP